MVVENKQLVHDIYCKTKHGSKLSFTHQSMRPNAAKASHELASNPYFIDALTIRKIISGNIVGWA